VLGYSPTGRDYVCNALESTTGAPHITLDSIIRLFIAHASDENITRQTELGKAAQFHLNSNQAIPDETLVEMVTSRLLEVDCREKGFILDGFPFTSKQAILLGKNFVAPMGVILLDADQIANDEKVRLTR
jgi:adenylate kinase